MCNLMYSLEEGTKAGEGKGDCFGGKNQNSEYCDKWEKLCGIFIKDKSNTVHLIRVNLMHTCRTKSVWPRSCPADKDLRAPKMEHMGKETKTRGQENITDAERVEELGVLTLHNKGGTGRARQDMICWDLLRSCAHAAAPCPQGSPSPSAALLS